MTPNPRRATIVRRVSAAAIVAAGLVAPAAPTAARSNWAIDPAHTRISFSIDATAYPRTDGVFRRFDGKVAVDFDQPSRSRVDFRVQSRSVDVGSNGFADYIRSPALLDAERFPEITFVSTVVEKLDDHRVRLTGDMTLLGQTRPIQVDVEVERKSGNRLGFTAHARINRLEFGMNSAWPVVSRDIDLVVASEAVEQ